MQCILLFKSAQGRLPTARELSRRGFVVSEAVLPAPGTEDAAVLALAAEPPAAYGTEGPAVPVVPAVEENAAQGLAQDRVQGRI